MTEAEMERLQQIERAARRWAAVQTAHTRPDPSAAATRVQVIEAERALLAALRAR